ncbi:MAG: NADH-quinone oxidoreductase subunit J [Pirellulaceae bacterium]|jgi:NADH-quinone oxidoreductase subunit J
MQSILTILFATIAIVAACGLVTFRHPIHAALSFAMAVFATAGLYVVLDSPYLAAATVLVYAGATIIVFLFVLMFSQQIRPAPFESKGANRLKIGVICGALVGLLLAGIDSWQPPARIVSATGSDITGDASTDPRLSQLVEGQTRPKSTVASLGRSMYTRYLWAMELAGTLLLIACIGALCIAQPTEAEEGMGENRS